jgi:bacterioferritin-associated ferredoxin
MLNGYAQGICRRLLTGLSGESSVIICHCEAVSDRIVRSTIRGGALDLDEVAARCGAGAHCGGCRTQIHQILMVEQPVELRIAV